MSPWAGLPRRWNVSILSIPSNERLLISTNLDALLRLKLTPLAPHQLSCITGQYTPQMENVVQTTGEQFATLIA
jgi:hypothetical protein